MLQLPSGLSFWSEISEKMGAEQSRDGNNGEAGGMEGMFDATIDGLKDMGLIYFPDPEQEAEDEYAPVDPEDATDMWNVAEVSPVHKFLIEREG